MAEEMRDHTYVGTADDNRAFVKNFIALKDLPVAGTPIYSNPAFTNGMVRESFKVTAIDAGVGAAGDFSIQERVNGVWVDKTSVGSAAITPNALIEHNADEQIRECRIKVVLSANPTETVPNSGVDAAGNRVGLYMEITGRRDR